MTSCQLAPLSSNAAHLCTDKTVVFAKAPSKRGITPQVTAQVTPQVTAQVTAQATAQVRDLLLAAETARTRAEHQVGTMRGWSVTKQDVGRRGWSVTKLVQCCC